MKYSLALSIFLGCFFASVPSFFAQSPPAQSFFVIHCDPGYATNLHFNRLRQMVDTATAHEVPLTLQFSPQWVDMILADTQKLALVRSWQAWGHEVAAHHHSIYHCYWDSLTNYPPDSIAFHQPISSNCPEGLYQGSMQSFWDALDVLAGDSLLLTWSSSDEHPAVDMYPNVPYRTDGGRDEPEQGFSNPYVKTHGPTTLDGQTYGPYTVCSIDYFFLENFADVQQMIDLYNDFAFSSQFEVVGVVTHVFNFQAAINQPPPNYFFTWIQFIEGKGCKTVRQILRESPACSSLAVEVEPIAAEVESSLRVYPNPASDVLCLQWEGHALPESCRIEVLDLQGRKLLFKKTACGLSIESLPPGSYFVRVWQEGSDLPLSCRFVKLE